jgi:uncharacterized damage-inducible protein DinB
MRITETADSDHHHQASAEATFAELAEPITDAATDATFAVRRRWTSSWLTRRADITPSQLLGVRP